MEPQASPSQRFVELDSDLALAKVGRDLTCLAQEWRSPRAVGVDAVLERLIGLLGRGRVSSVILIGESGVGKSVLVEELARRIADDEAGCVNGRRVVQTSLSEIWGYVGASDNWAGYLKLLKSILAECKKLGAILFMDEIHNIFGHQYSMSYLRPALARGELTIIGATTHQEYLTYIGRNEATARRFRLLRLEEPNEQGTLAILQNAVKNGSLGDGVQKIDADVLRYLVRLTNTYIPYQAQPAKALNILEQVVVENLDAGARASAIKANIRRVVCNAVGIPEEAIRAPKERLQAMATVLNARILGQEHVVEKVCKRLLVAKAGTRVTPERPHGVFLLAGPTGVGKTEFAKVLAEFLTGDEKNLIRIDMSAYSDPFSVRNLIGLSSARATDEADEVPFLTRALRSKPYTVLLLDEIEKAHRHVRLLFLHAFDTGRMVDALGNLIDLRTTVIIMTTNLGFSTRKAVIGFPGEQPARRELEFERVAQQALEEEFPKEFLGRVDDICFFRSLTGEIMAKFVQQKARLLQEITGKTINLTARACALLCDKGFSPQYGARDLNRAIDDLLGHKLAELRLSDEWSSIETVCVDAPAEGNELSVRGLPATKEKRGKSA